MKEATTEAANQSSNPSGEAEAQKIPYGLPYLQHVGRAYYIGIKWILFGVLAGVLIGSVSAVFSRAIAFVTVFRKANPWILFFLPAAGPAIVLYYRLLGIRKARGTNLVLDAIRSGEHIPVRMAPLIIVSTVLTHLFGGSVGREGAALQVGGSLGEAVGSVFRMNSRQKKIAIMTGMSASFSALFGTPLAAAILAMEISTVGIMNYSALLPCVISALSAHLVAKLLGAEGELLTVHSVPDFDPKTFLTALIFSICAALVSVLFSVTLHQIKHLAQDKLKNPYLRSFLCASLLLGMSLLAGDQTYNGTGSSIIEQCITDPTFRILPAAFLLKILFTSVTLAGGFQGGEIVPSLFIGATFGNAYAQLTGLNPVLTAALGMTCVFAGVTNCPISALLLAFELFGFKASSYLLIAVAITYLFSGNYGIYASQRIHHSKYGLDITDQKTH